MQTIVQQLQQLNQHDLREYFDKIRDRKTRRIDSPIHWFGGKCRMIRYLLPFVPEHKVYVELFGGGASLLLAKKPSPVEIYNDIDSGLVNFFKVLIDEKMFAEFKIKVSLLACSRELWKEYKETWQLDPDPVMRAVKWFVVARQSFSGEFGHGWSSSFKTIRRGVASSVSSWLGCVDKLPEVHGRLQLAQIECMDWRHVINKYDSDETFFYFDPPYVKSTRSEGRYKCELEYSDHVDLVNRLVDLKGMALLTMYDHKLYSVLLSDGWGRIKLERICDAAGRTRGTGLLGDGGVCDQVRVEYIWMNSKLMGVL